MRVEHGFIDARVGTLVTLEWFRTKMVPEMILQVVLVFCDKWAFWASEHLFLSNVSFGMIPKIFLGYCLISTLLTFKSFDLLAKIFED
jgi:hypothetical protein